MTESNTREFWIWGFKIAPDESISQNCLVSMDKGGSAFYDPVHHVIEFSAYQAEQEKVKELVEAVKPILERLNRGTIIAPKENINQLNKAFIKAKE